jgi:hypothetical protein
MLAVKLTRNVGFAVKELAVHFFPNYWSVSWRQNKKQTKPEITRVRFFAQRALFSSFLLWTPPEHNSFVGKKSVLKKCCFFQKVFLDVSSNLIMFGGKLVPWWHHT